MFLSWLRPRRKPHNRPASFRPSLLSLDERIVPTSAHFIYATSSVNAAGALVVSFKEAGLGDNQNIDYTVTGNQLAKSSFTNNGGNVVQGQPFNAVDATLASGAFNSGKNGNVVGTLTSGVPDLPVPKQVNGRGWVQTVDITYTNCAINDVTNGVSAAVADTSFHSVTPVVK